MKQKFIDKLLSAGHKIAINTIYRFMSNKQIVLIEYFLIMHKILNLKSPQTFSEKLQWIKLYGNMHRYSKYVDKYEVRKFISKTIGAKYLIPILGVWESVEDILFYKLPKQFVIKTTHASHQVIVCKNKSDMNINEVKNKLKFWLKENFYKETMEMQYKGCKPKVICEQYMEDESGGLIDYKIHCFNGKPSLIEVLSDRFTGSKPSYVYMDLNWKKLKMLSLGYPVSERTFKKPKKFKEMIQIAIKLSSRFPYVRVDLYSVKNKVYFGELTFTPAGGYETFDPPEINYNLGKLIDLNSYKVT